MAQHGNIYTGKLKDIASSYLTPHHMYFAYDTKELYSFNPDQTPYKLFDQDNEVRVIQIQVADLPLEYTKQDVLDYLNTIGFDKGDIDTIAVEIVGASDLGDGYPITWGFISDKPTFFPPTEHFHSWNDITDKPDLTQTLNVEEVEDIISSFLVQGDGIELIYDPVLDVIKFNVTGEMDQDNINIVVNVASEALSTVDDLGLATYLNNLNPPLLIEGTHNIYFKIDTDEGSTQFDYIFDFNLA